MTPESQQAAHKERIAMYLHKCWCVHNPETKPWSELTATEKAPFFADAEDVFASGENTPAPVDHAAPLTGFAPFTPISNSDKPRAHSAGGVSEPSEDVVERCAKLLDPWIWRDLADHEDTPDNRNGMQVFKAISRDRMNRALRAAGIGAGVVESDKQ